MSTFHIFWVNFSFSCNFKHFAYWYWIHVSNLQVYFLCFTYAFPLWLYASGLRLPATHCTYYTLLKCAGDAPILHVSHLPAFNEKKWFQEEINFNLKNISSLPCAKCSIKSCHPTKNQKIKSTLSCHSASSGDTLNQYQVDKHEGERSVDLGDYYRGIILR